MIKLIYQYSCDSHIGSRGNALDIPDILSYLKKAKKKYRVNSEEMQETMFRLRNGIFMDLQDFNRVYNNKLFTEGS